MKKSNPNVNTEDLKPRMIEFICGLEQGLGREIIISSGYRGPEHPIEAAKDTPGVHSTGLAIDVECKNPVDFIKTVGEAYGLGCRRVGVNRNRHFVHLDLDSNRPSSLWPY